MDAKKHVSFEEMVKQNERRIHYQIHKLNVYDPHNEFYQEGLVAMWNAYEKYKPDKGMLSTYFNYTIRNRLIDLIRKKTALTRSDDMFFEAEKQKVDHGNRTSKSTLPLPALSDINVQDLSIWERVHTILTENQWKWVYYFIILEMPIKDIAAREGTSVDAVKSWSRQARKELREEGFKEKMKNSMEV